MARILIADDSRFQVQLISAYLEPKGFAVSLLEVPCRPG